MNGQIKQDIHRLIGCQDSFNDEDCGKRKINSWEIKELDFVSAKTGHSLRDYIMGIRQVDTDCPLFHSVDHMRFNRSTVVFTCMPAVESEARHMVASLLTFLKHFYQDDVTEFFTKDAQLRAATSYWDEDEQCVRNEDDTHVSSLLSNLDEDYVLPPVRKKGSKPSEQSAPKRPVPTTPSLQRNTFGEDDDSIQTFHRDQQQDAMSDSSTTSASVMSLASLTSRLMAIENLLTLHNIALPANPPSSTITEDSPSDREGGDN